MIDFDTENLVIFCYPKNAGGKFMINCLGLSEGAVFQDNRLVNKQVNGNFSSTDKFQLLKTRLDNTTEWMDLRLGCHKLFGVYSEEYLELPIEEIKQKLEFKQKIPFENKIMCVSPAKPLKFFIIAHNYKFAQCYLNVWKNAKIVVFLNTKKFINWRTKGSSESYNEFGDAIEEGLLPVKNVIHYFNNDDYFDMDATVLQIKILYQTLNLPDFNEQMIRDYHLLWMNKLKEIVDNDNTKQ